MMERIYLDWNATAPLRPAARAAVLAALDHVGNASSVHQVGQRVRRAIDVDGDRVRMDARSVLAGSAVWRTVLRTA